MLTIEFDETLSRVVIHANAKGIRFLRRKLRKTRKAKTKVLIKDQLGTETIGVGTVVAREMLLCFSESPDSSEEAASNDQTAQEKGGKKKKAKKSAQK